MLQKVPRYAWVATIVGLLISLPSLAVGFYADDYNHLLLLAGYDTGAGRPFDIYRFMMGNLSDAIYAGPFPWWTNPDLRIAFLRPIASAMFMLDHALFGMNAVGYHAHALLWYGLLVFTVAMFYGRLFRSAAK